MVNEKVDAYKSQEWKGADLIHMLVLLLPNLEHLSLQTSHHLEFLNIPMSFLAKAGTRKLPLRTLDLAFCGAIRTGERPFTSMPNLEVLRITHSRLDYEELDALISACVKLEELHYKAANPDRPPAYSPPHNHFQNASKHLSILGDFAVLAHLSLNSRLGCSSEETAPFDTDFLARCIAPTLHSVSLIGEVPSRALPHLARSLLDLAQVIRARQLPAFKRIRLDAELQLADYGMAEVFAGANVELPYENWPSSKATVLMADWMPPTCSIQDMPLPPDLEDPDLV
ncbi:hypothetical protein G7054_g2208 [Neopestalotiopsis clavispora]|nr:hypothetical protein G7054_g2208 [Neopestalotiopsis clavispora]